MTRAVGRFGDKTRVSIPARTSVSEEQKRRASLEVSRQARGPDDCREPLGMLGLMPTRGAAADQEATGNTVTLPTPDLEGPA
jgi:hypothetical protein